MRIVSHKKLKDFYETSGREDAKVPLEYWYHKVEDAQWRNFAEMKADFGSVDNVGNQHYVFNIGGNKYRLVVVVKYVMGYVFIRFVGTYKEYDKIDASTI
ncbi:MAG: type II toxin-antitoxin system HigB family toxin [Paludibacteraceae bacterium]|nr:type II toxin-antitoxin system HigB family toxin [Paludibacteraceae bacterium]MBR6286765.1 type II toxin-antitoxin system HigB family toxin [Bacteroidaceae bacterium]